MKKMTTNTIKLERNVCIGMMIVTFYQDGQDVGNAGFDYDETDRMTNAINCFVTTGNIHY